jgi:hypothetical protein
MRCLLSFACTGFGVAVLFAQSGVLVFNNNQPFRIVMAAGTGTKTAQVSLNSSSSTTVAIAVVGAPWLSVAVLGNHPNCDDPGVVYSMPKLPGQNITTNAILCFKVTSSTTPSKTDPKYLAQGWYRAYLRVTFSGGIYTLFPVRLQVTPAGYLQLQDSIGNPLDGLDTNLDATSASGITINAYINTNTGEDQSDVPLPPSVRIQYSSVDPSTSSAPSWLRVTDPIGLKPGVAISTPYTFQLSVDPSGIPPGATALSADFDVMSLDGYQDSSTVHITVTNLGLLTFTISGQITASGFGLSGAVVTLSGSSNATMQTNSSGNYAFSGLAYGGSYTITPALAGYTFSPTSLSVASLTGNQVLNFTANSLPAISGHVGSASGQSLSGVTVSLTGSLNAIAQTDAFGNYLFSNLSYGGSYTVAPAFGGYTFNPASLSIASLTANQVLNFTANLPPTISGHVASASGQSIGGVNIAFSNGGPLVSTDVNGNYSATLFSGYTGVGTPSRSGYSFTPASRSYVNLASNSSNQDYTATTVATSKSDRPGLFRQGFLWFQDVDGNQQINVPPDRVFGLGGIPGDIPVSGDWNGSGTSKAGVFRPNYNGQWVLDWDGTGQNLRVYYFGGPGDLPVVGDWTGSGSTRIGIFHQGFLWILDAAGHGTIDSSNTVFPLGGIAGDIPLVGDWNGNRISKPGLFRQGFLWILDLNGDHQITNGDAVFGYGGYPGDVPIVGDWTGTGVTQIGIFRQGFLWVLDSNGDRQIDTGDLIFAMGGIPGDKPVIGKW